MEDIVAIVAQRTGLSEDQPQQAVETIVGLLRERLRSRPAVWWTRCSGSRPERL